MRVKDIDFDRHEILVRDAKACLIVYGGRGRAARNWQCFDAILRSLEKLEPDETLLV